MTNTQATATTRLDRERADFLESLAKQRFFLKNTLRGLTDEQAAARPTASALCLGGIIKHVTGMERQWAGFINRGPAVFDFDPASEASAAQWVAAFEMTDDDTIESLIAAYDAASAETDAVIAAIDDFDAARPLPPAPWFEPGAVWSARRTLTHLLAELAQHSGHADIIRESIDGAKSMG